MASQVEKDRVPSRDEKSRLRYLYQPWTLLLAFYRAKIITVEPAIILFMMAKHVYIPLYEQYYYQNYGSDILQNTSFLFPNSSFCLTSEMIDNYTGNNNSYKLDQSFSNHLVAYGQVANRVPSIFITILMGPLTDRFGRKMGVYLPALGNTLQGIFSIFIIKYNLNPYYFILANFIGGIFGDFTGILASSFSYVADISSPRWRSLRIGLVESGLAFGGSIGVFFGGYWLNKINCDFIPVTIFYTACNFAAVVYVILFVPESLTKSERKKIVNKNPKGIRAYFQGIKLFGGSLSFLSTWKLYVAIIAANVLVLNIAGNILISVYFLKTPPFSFNPLQIGIYQSTRSAAQGVANLVFVGGLVLLSISDVWIMLTAVLVNFGCNMCIGFSNKAWEVYTIAAVQGIEGTGWTGARSFMSKLVKPEQQGALFSVVASAEGVSGLVASAFWPLIYPATLQHNMRPGMIYIFMAVLIFMVLPLLISLLLFKNCTGGEIVKDTIETSIIQSSSSRRRRSSSESTDSEEEEYKPLLTSSKSYYGVNT